MSRFSLVAIALFATGCASTGLESLEVPELPELPLISEKEPEVPTRVIPVWTDTVLHRGGKTVRGFGGRVIFYGSEQDRPIKVDGAVVVYAWDDTAGRGKEAPDRKYMFKAGSMEKHHSPSKIGHSYSFWLPWDAVGSETKHITLVTRFVSTAGGEVTSSAAHVVLPGPMRAEPEQADTEPRKLSVASELESPTLLSTPDRPQIHQLGFEEVAVSDDRASNATTIDLPLHLARGPHYESDPIGVPRQDRDGITVAEFDSAGELVQPERPTFEAVTDSPGGSSSRFGPRQLPVRSSRSNRRFSSREQTQPDRLASRFGSSRKQRRPHVSVQQKIARDAAEAKARRAEAWGQYQSTNWGQD